MGASSRGHKLRQFLDFTLATGAFAWVAWCLRAARARVWPALAGLALLAAYVALRLVSLHAVDAWLRAGPVPARDAAEPLALVLVLAGALRRPRAVSGADAPRAA